MQAHIFYITLKDIKPKQNRNRIYTIAVGHEDLSESYTVKLYWGRVGAKRQRKIYTCRTKEELNQFINKVLRIRLKHGYKLVEKHKDTPSYSLLVDFEVDSLHLSGQLKMF